MDEKDIGRYMPLKSEVDRDVEAVAVPGPAFAEPLPSQGRRSRARFWSKAAIACFAAVYLAFGAINFVTGDRHSLFADNASYASRPGRKWMSRKQVEDLYLSVPNPESAILASRLFASKPHMAGTEGDRQTAKLFYDVLVKELGAVPPTDLPAGSEPIFDAGSEESRSATLSSTQWKTSNQPTAWIDKYFPVMNTPLDRSLQILGEDGDVAWEADVEETADMTDPEAGEYKYAIPAFHGLSKGGTAEGQLVYAGYGTKADYDKLVADGVNVTGKVVIVKYGGVFRGLKVKGAAELGASACLIYSDLADDGAVTEKNGYAAYPEGPARNPTSVQRGSVQYLSIYPGDPTTPGYPAYENATRTDGTNIPDIPSLPISWANAKVLLDEIKEGGQNRTVKLVNNVDTRVIPIWNTMGVIPGHIRDEVVVIGNHRDAWVMGATDPSSGTASIHEMIRGIGELMRAGWRPLRTIVIASWDAEEYGLIGSTEWGEDFADWIRDHVVAYLNLDSSVSGSRYGSSASPSLAYLVREAAEKVGHPTDTNRTLWDARSDMGTFFGDSGLDAVDEDVLRMYELETGASAVDNVGVGVLGSGSDYTVFLQHIGVASANGGFGRTATDPAYHYHSVYDSVRWQEMYADPGFFRHVAVAKHLGLQALALSGSVILPLNTTHYARELEVYLNRVQAIATSTDGAEDLDLAPLRESLHNLQSASLQLDQEKARAQRQFFWALKKWRKARAHHRLRHKIRRGICKIRAKLGHPCHHHGGDDNSQEQQDEQNTLQTLSQGFNGGMAPRWVWKGIGLNLCMRGGGGGMFGALHGHGGGHRGGGRAAKRLMKAAKRVRAANQKLIAFERGMISEDGLKGREWYTNLAVAPGLNLGYGATTLPGLTEALTIEKNSTLAAYEAGRLKGLVDNLAEVIRP